VLTFQSGVEVFIEQVKGLLIFAVQDDLDSVLQIDRHLLVVQVVICLLAESFFGRLSLGLYAKD
jgi:hypothetical protein